VLHEFLSANRDELIERCLVKVSQRPRPKAIAEELKHGVPRFLDQLIKTLRVEQTSDPARSAAVSGPAGGGAALSEIGVSAARHGRELLLQGFTVDQVVHDYGDLCQAITDLAFEKGTELQVDEFRTLNRCLDNAIAGAVMEFSYQRDSLVADRTAEALNERLGFLAHELRNLIHTATLAFTALKAGDVGVAGATGAVLDRSLIGLRTLIDRSLAEVRVTAGMPIHPHLISLSDFIAEVKVSAGLEAQSRRCGFVVHAVDPKLALDVDRDLLFSAVGNLLQNAFKFTENETDVTLSAYAVSDRIRIDVEDHCGGLQRGQAERMFEPFEQFGANRSGLGLGLSISQRSVIANQGTLSVRSTPGRGCVFTIDLPRHALAEA
jgi:signal transduction histidine kinase